MKIPTDPKVILESPRMILIESKIWEKEHSYHIFTAEEDNAEKKSWIFHVPRDVYEENGNKLGIGDPFCCEYCTVDICGEKCKKVKKIKPLDADHPPLDLNCSHEKDDEKQKEDEEEDFER